MTGVCTTVLGNIETMVPMVLVDIMGGLIGTIVFTAMIILFEWRVGLVALAGIVLYFLVVSSMERKSEEIAPNAQKPQTALTSAVLEYVQGMGIVMSFLVFGQIRLFGMGMSMLRLVSASIDRTMQTEEMEQMDEKGRTFSPKGHGVEFDHVRFSYENKEILHDISVKLPDKTTTAVIGPSGSGKTTLCNLIARFWDVDSGSVKIGGKDVREYTLESLVDQISMVFQSVYFFADTIENNIKFGRPDATHAEVVEAARKACCTDFIEALPNGYDTMIGEGGASLSGGEKQRISIARAMLKDAPIVILDDCEIIGLTRRNPIKSRVLPC